MYMLFQSKFSFLFLFPLEIHDSFFVIAKERTLFLLDKSVVHYSIAGSCGGSGVAVFELRYAGFFVGPFSLRGIYICHRSFYVI